MGLTGGVSGSRLFDVHVPTLHTVAARLHEDASHVRSEGEAAAAGARSAAAACGGGPLAAALGRFEAELRDRSRRLSDAVDKAGDLVAVSARIYTSDDTIAARSFAPLF